MLSSFTMISVIGVMLGVLVLVVVMAVYAGLEREVKGRILGFTPHILVRHQMLESGVMTDSQWVNIAEQASKLEGVAAATAYVADNVIIDVESWQRPAQFRAIDTSDPAQVEGITSMLDLKHHPESSADLGIDDLAVISSTLSEQYGIGVGAVIRLYSTRNFEEVMRAYKTTENPPLREAYAEGWAQVATTLRDGWQETDGKAVISIDALNHAYSILRDWLDEPIRTPEQELVDGILSTMEQGAEAGERDQENGVYRLDPAIRSDIDQQFAALGETDAEKMDGDILKGLKSIVLPKEVTVSGVYQTSQMAVTPDLFVPLPLARDLAGLDEGVQGVALRLDDAYRAEQVAAQARESLPPSWSFLTWGDQYQAFFALISQQRVMMYFALSFIVLVSAFSMMAVMFTVTIQKRREIGVMKALGAAPGQIVRVFLYQGMLLGAIGAVLGISLGHLVVYFRGPIQASMRSLGFDPFSASLTGFGILPAHHDAIEQIVIGLSAFLLCSLAALVPAFFAARSDAAKSLRNL